MSCLIDYRVFVQEARACVLVLHYGSAGYATGTSLPCKGGVSTACSVIGAGQSHQGWLLSHPVSEYPMVSTRKHINRAWYGKRKARLEEIEDMPFEGAGVFWIMSMFIHLPGV